MNHCSTAQQLLWQASVETRCDVAILSDPYRIPPEDVRRVADKDGLAAIVATGKYPIQEIVSNSYEGFVIAKINGVFICSCYAPPRWSMDQFNDMLDRLTADLNDRRPVVIAGDFNAWAVEWGSRITTTRGANLLEAVARLDVVLANEGTTTTFRRNGRESIVDVTFCSPSLAGDLNWKVSEDYTFSDHQAICYVVGSRTPAARSDSSTKARRWRTKAFDRDLFVEALRTDRITTTLEPRELSRELARACDTAMPRILDSSRGRRSVYWWSEEIQNLRSRCKRARRYMQRARSDPDRERRRPAYKEARAALKQEIRRRKLECFRRLCDEADDNPWGDAYRTVLKKFSVAPTERCPIMLRRIVEGLFPQHEPAVWPSAPQAIDTVIPIVTLEELRDATTRMKEDKAPGPDGIPNVALKVAIQEYPDMFRKTMQKCLDDCVFPDIWKRQQLILLPKPGKPPGDPSSYRPICLLDTLGKLLERIINSRLLEYVEGEGGLADTQYGFRKGRSTVDAISRVVAMADKALKRKKTGNRYCAIVTIDVRNAFNSASWEAIAVSLHRMGVPDQLSRMLRSYFENRVLLYDTDEGQKSVQVSAGVPQGSILGPTLWNAMYNDVLTLKLPIGVEVVGFADDIVMMVTGKSCEEVELLATGSVRAIGDWMSSVRLKIAHHKTELVMVSNRKSAQRIEITVGGQRIASQRSIKYLGVMIDDRLSFKSHVNYVEQKAAKAINALTRMMPNRMGPRSSKRRLLANVVTSILRYGGPSWIPALNTMGNQKTLRRPHRLAALRVVSAFRTVSYDAACVLAGMIPIRLLLLEDNECYQGRLNGRDTSDVREAIRPETLRRWQGEWDGAEYGRWTYQLIPDVTAWLNRRHGEVDFFLTQLLSGHGFFRKYLHKRGFASSEQCPECGFAEQTPEHVFFNCTRFEEVRRETFDAAGVRLTADNVVSEMCKDERTWAAICRLAKCTMTVLQQRWNSDQRQQVSTGEMAGVG